MRMRGRLMLALAMAVAVGVPPWLAWREARRQAYETEAELALGYARDVLHRADAAGTQAATGIRVLAQSGLPPCSPESEALMRRINLTSPYIQGMGHTRAGVLVCSSFGDSQMPLGQQSFHASSGYTFYFNVPLEGRAGPLLAIEKDGYAVLIHRDLPLDI